MPLDFSGPSRSTRSQTGNHPIDEIPKFNSQFFSARILESLKDTECKNKYAGVTGLDQYVFDLVQEEVSVFVVAKG